MYPGIAQKKGYVFVLFQFIGAFLQKRTKKPKEHIAFFAMDLFPLEENTVKYVINVKWDLILGRSKLDCSKKILFTLKTTKIYYIY